MDILIAEDDNLVSLEEALAFIDACDVHDESLTDVLMGTGALSSNPLEAFTPSQLLTPKAATPTPKKRAPRKKLSDTSSSQGENPKKRRTRSAASSSTRLQQKKRAEIQALRGQARELEAHVELLKRSKFMPGDVVLELDAEVTDVLVTNQKAPSSWHEMAIAQYKERLVSEKTNRRLKAILNNQEKVNGALGGLLQKRSVLHGMEYVLSTLPGQEQGIVSMNDSGPGLDDNEAVLRQLEASVKRLYTEFKPRFTELSQSPTISCDMKIKHDVKRGKMIEFVTRTPMSCSVMEASDILWMDLTTYRESPDKEYKYMKDTKPNSHEKNFVLCVRSPSGMLELNGLQYMEKFEEMDRTVLVVAERMLLPTKGFQFRDECWTTVTPSASDANSSVVEIFLQLYMERDDGLEASAEDISYAQNIVMGSLSNTFRKTFQAQQNSLMEKAGRITVSVPTLPFVV